MLHTQKHKKKSINQSINQTNKVDMTYLGDYNHHRFGLAPQNTSSLLVNTAPAQILQSSMFYHRLSIESPAINAFKRRRNRQRVTTSLPIVITTPLRGDQQPPNDDDNNNQDDIEVFVPLGVKNQPVTVPPIYFTNEHDSTQRRITFKNKKLEKKQTQSNPKMSLFPFCSPSSFIS